MVVAHAGASSAIATPHPLATRAGAQVLGRGGSAAEAAVAANAVLCVVYPHMCSLGGDAFAVVHDAEGAWSVNGSGRSPQGLDMDAVERTRHHPAQWERAAHTVTVPGTVAAWAELVTRFGDGDLGSLLEPAVHAAASGVKVAPSLSRALERDQDLLRTDPGASSVLLDGARPRRVGTVLRQSALARTLRAIQAGGAHAFYEGSVSERLVAGARALGLAISAEDLTDHRTIVEEPLARRIRIGGREFEVVTSPPNSQGVLLLHALERVASSGLGADPLDPDVACAMADAAREGATWRDLHLADPARMRVSDDDLLQAEAPLGATPLGPRRATGDTVGIVARDRRGAVVSLIQSVFLSFGAGRLDPGTGVLFQNRGACFSRDPRAANAAAPGVRPAHSLMPVIVLDDTGRPALVSATMGGLAQPQIQAQLLHRVLGLGQDVDAAVAAPRWIVDPPPLDGDPWCIASEPDVAPHLTAAWQQSGYPSRSVEWRDDVLGHAQVISIAGGLVRAASDPRADGNAIVL